MHSEHADEIVTKHLELHVSVLCYGFPLKNVMCVRIRNCGETSLFEGLYVTNWQAFFKIFRMVGQICREGMDENIVNAYLKTHIFRVNF